MNIKKIVIAFFVFALSASPLMVRADEGVFDPQFVLSDVELSNWNSMDASDIQAFLDTQRGTLNVLTAIDVDGVQKTAAEIIAAASRRNQINPRVLLVMLQKEQSLVGDSTPSINSIGWAMGYALCDSCDPNDPKIAKHKGFATQVDSAAGILRYYIDHHPEKPWIKRAGQNYTIDNTLIIPSTNATAFLYTYTPHIEGNRNFWNLWRTWFRGRLYPDGVVIKTATSPDVWYVDGGKRRSVTSINILRSYFDESSIITVDPQDISLLSIGEPLQFPNYAVIHTSEDDRTYLNVDQTLFALTSKEVMRALGFSPAEVVEASVLDIAGYERGSFITSKSVYPTGAVLKARKSGELVYVQNGFKYPLIDTALLATNFKSVKPAIINDKALNEYIEKDPVPIKDGNVVMIKGKSDVYLISGGQKRHIINEKVFASLKLEMRDVVTVSSALLNLHPTGPAITLDPSSSTPILTAFK